MLLPKSRRDKWGSFHSQPNIPYQPLNNRISLPFNPRLYRHIPQDGITALQQQAQQVQLCNHRVVFSDSGKNLLGDDRVRRTYLGAD